MKRKKRILALITARAGSKRILNKNIRLLSGIPLIKWSIDSITGIQEICDVLVSTDSPEIAEVASNAGATVPWLRPEKLSTDTATSVEVCLHALNWYERECGFVDGLLLLQPTSPFRYRDRIESGILKFYENKMHSVIGVSPARDHPFWCFKLENLSMTSFIEGDGLKKRSQELPPAFVINGSFYLIQPNRLRNELSLFSSDMIPLVMDKPEEGIDIDNEWDWQIAEMFAERNLC